MTIRPALHGRAAIRVGIVAVAALLMLPAVASADTVTVNTVADHNDKVCDVTDCTLREAVELSTNANGKPITGINLPKGHYTLSAALGELVLVNDHIVGAGAHAAIIDGANETRVLRAGDGTSTIDGVTVTRGNGASSVSSGAGGGIFVGSGAMLNVTASTIETNSTSSGGGIYVDTGGTLDVATSTISGNAAFTGGGIDVAGALVMDTSLVAGNMATGRLPLGAGIASTGGTILRNSTVSGNAGSGTTSQGGGIFSSGTLGLNGVTISNNTANAAAGLLENAVGAAAPPPRILFNTIVGGNNGPECAGAGLDTDTTHNSIGEDTTCAFTDATDQQGVNPQLRPLANNGGPTDTHALIPTSPALNKGASCFGGIDQRSVVRPQGAACDVGAFEYRSHALNVITTVVNNNGGTLAASGVQVHVRVDGADTSGSPAAGVGGSGRAYSLLTGNSFVVEANAVAGYSISYSTGCSATIVEGGANTCTVTVDDIAPRLSIVTAVTNNNGGTKQAGDFTVHVRQSGTDVSGSPQAGSTGGTAYVLSAGTYAVAADAVTGYSSGTCSVTLAVGDNKTCTITADDVQPRLTVKTLVTNDNGGTKAASDFSLHVRSGGADVTGSPAAGTATGRLYTLNAGAYAVAADSVAGYSLSGTCSMTLVVGDDKTCTITADDIAPKLRVITTVQNTHGGTATAADFNAHVRQSGRDVTGSPQAGSGTGNNYTLTAGSFSVSADGVPGYSGTGSGGCAADGSVTLAIGDDKTCTITVADGAPTLTVMTQVINDNGGTKTPGDVLAHVRTGLADVTGSPQVGTSAGTLYSLLAGTAYTVVADPMRGYTMSVSGDCAANGSITLVLGQPKSCTLVANDVAPTLTVITTVTNDNGGTAGPAGFSVHVRSGGADVGGSPQAGNASGTTYTLMAGSYAVSSDAVSGYTTAIGGACVANGSVSLAAGDAKTCTVAANDNQVAASQLPPPVIYKSVNLLPSQGKVLIKPPGSKKFVAIVDGQQVPVGTVVDVRKGRVTLIAAADANGGIAQAVFYGGIFKLGQTKSKTPITVLSLVEKLTGCKAKGKATIAKKKVKKRRLWGDGHGHFSTKGKHSAATVVGTKWLVQDSCSSTLTKVARGRVKVRDFEKHKTVFVTKGHKYVARARR